MPCPLCLSNEHVKPPGMTGNGFPSLGVDKVSMTWWGDEGFFGVIMRFTETWIMPEIAVRNIFTLCEETLRLLLTWPVCDILLADTSGTRHRWSCRAGVGQVSLHECGVPSGDRECKKCGEEGSEKRWDESR